MYGYNEIKLLGNVTNDPIISELPNESRTKKVSFHLAVNRKNAAKLKEEGKQDVDYFLCEAFGSHTETIGTYLKKGDPLFVSGTMLLDRLDKQTEEGLKVVYYPKVNIIDYRLIADKK